jgi:uncharacterized protein (TIGR04141 family)
MSTLIIFLLKDNVPDPVDAVDPDKPYTTIPLTGDLGLPGVLFVGTQHHATPQWVNMLNPFLEQQVGAVYTASIAALLVVQYQDRLFALTFGFGRTLLKPNCWVRDFGLRATLNRVDHTKLRSIDSKIYDEMVVSTRRQTSRTSKVDTFELDVSRALLRGVTGEPDQNDIFTRLTGSGPVRASTELQLDRLPDVLHDLLSAYGESAYQQHFGWVDNVREVDAGTHAQLDQLLLNALQAGNPADAYLSAPEIVDWDHIYRFSYPHAGAVLYLELSLTEYLAVLNAHNIPVTLDVLMRHRVRVQYDGDEALYDKWTIYECLVWETAIGNRRFVLMDGLWFQIAPDFATAVADFLTSITSNFIPFPNAAAGQREGDYNEAIEAQDPANFAMLDREPFYPTGASSPIEFCDLFSTAGHLIHVKKRASSGMLSHLFSQGSVSSALFLQDPALRASITQRLDALGMLAQAALIPAARPNSSDYEVVYAVIAPQMQGIWPPPLPFFSSVNLMHHAQLVRNLGYNVSLQYIRQL